MAPGANRGTSATRIQSATATIKLKPLGSADEQMAILLADLFLCEKREGPAYQVTGIIGIFVYIRKTQMRMEYILIALLLVAAFFGSRRVKVSASVETTNSDKVRQKNRDDKTYFTEEFQNKAEGLVSKMIGQLNGASSNGMAARSWRSSLEESVRTIERELSEQDRNSVVTSGSELNVIKGKEHMPYSVWRFIRYQQGVHQHVEQVRDCIYDLQRLSMECSEWASDKDEVIRESAARLCHRIDNDTAIFFSNTDEMLVAADKDPVGIRDEFVTAKVTEFRKELKELFRKTRSDLVAEAK